MNYDLLTGRWHFSPYELWEEQDHQAHVAMYRRANLARQRAIAHHHWTHPTRPAYRNPTIKEDPHAYR